MPQEKSRAMPGFEIPMPYLSGAVLGALHQRVSLPYFPKNPDCVRATL